VNFSNIFSFFLLVCIMQTIASISLLAIKKYRRIPNLFLLASFILFLIHYAFYFFEYFGYFKPDHFRASAIMPFQILPPILIYLYSYTRMHGNITGIRELSKYFMIFIIAILLFIPIITDSFSVHNTSPFFSFYSHVYRIVFSFVIIAMYIIYARRIVVLFAHNMDIKADNVIYELMKLPNNLRIVKPIVFLLFSCGVWFLLELFLSIFIGDMHKYIDFLIASTLCILSLVLSYVFIKNPKEIQN